MNSSIKILNAISGLKHVKSQNIVKKCDMNMLDDDEDVIYLEHGCDPTSSHSSNEKQFLQSNKSAEKNFISVQDAPKFRRKDISSGGVTVRYQKRKSSTAFSMVESISPSADDRDDGDAVVQQSSQSSPNFDLHCYTPKRFHSAKEQKNVTARSLGARKNPHSRGSRQKDPDSDPEELDRPEHWRKVSHRNRRSGNHNQGDDRQVRFSSRGDVKQKSSRLSHSLSSSTLSSGTVSVTKPFSLAIADKVMQQQKEGKRGSVSGELQLSFRPSWLPSARTGRREVSRGAEEIDVASQDHASDDDKAQESGRDHFQSSRSEEMNSFQQLPPATKAAAVVSFDPSFNSSNSESIQSHRHDDSLHSSPYSSDQESLYVQSHPVSRRSNRGKKKTHDQDIMPKYLRMKRLQAELEVRFQAISQGGGRVSRRGKEESGQFRSGDLLDPRSRTQKHLDVTVQTHRGSSGGLGRCCGACGGEGGAVGGAVIWNQPPFIVLSLRVEEAREKDAASDSNCSVSDVEQKMRYHEGGQEMMGYFRPETFSKMSISLAAGQRLRVYNSVTLPAPSPCSCCSTVHAVRDESSSPSDAVPPPRPMMLLCTSLCEAL